MRPVFKDIAIATAFIVAFFVVMFVGMLGITLAIHVFNQLVLY